MHDKMVFKKCGFKAICTLVCLPYSRVQLKVHLICNSILILFNLCVKCFACIYMVLGIFFFLFSCSVKNKERDGVGMIDKAFSVTFETLNIDNALTGNSARKLS